MPGKLEKGGLSSMGESGQGQSPLIVQLTHIYCGASFRWLGDASILSVTNKWRKERGLPDIPSHLLDRRQEGTA
jgi:hypothetical protein